MCSPQSWASRLLAGGLALFVGLVVEVRDHGKGFDWEGPPEQELPEGGLGISIIQAVCDEFEMPASLI